MGDYPRLLTLDDDVAAALSSFIMTEINRHYAERETAIDELIGWQTDYWAKPATTRRTFPFNGAANIIIPLTAIAFEAVHARTMTTIWAVAPIASIKAQGRFTFPSGDVLDLSEAENPTENFVHHEIVHSIKAYKPINDAVSEIEKFGTGIAKTGYEKIIKKAIRSLPDGREEEIPVITKDGAAIDAVPLANFIMSHSYKDPQTAPWCGELHSQTPYDIWLGETSGLFYDGTFDKLKNWVSRTTMAPGQERRYERAQEELENRVSVLPQRIDWIELWLAFDVDKDRKLEELVVYWHRYANVLMGVRYNWYDDLHRPYRIGNYVSVEGRWRGLGLAKQNEQFQKEVTTIHRQRLDNATLANMRMIRVHKLSGYGPGEPIFPGKMWFLDDMTHVDTIQLGEVYPSSFSNEQATLIYAQQRSGVNEVTLGMPQVGTPGTATSDLARIQEGSKKFDYTFMNIKMFLNDVMLDTFCNIVQFGPKNIKYFDVVEHGDLLRKVLTLPVSAIRESIVFEVAAAGAQTNRMLDRQNWQQVGQYLAGYYQSMIQLAQMSGSPQIMQMIMKKAFTAATEAMKQILETFNIRNIDRLLLTELTEAMLNGGNGSAQPVPQPGGGGGPQNNGSAPGLDRLAQITALLRGGSPS